MELMDSCNPAVQNLATAINKLRKENRRLRKAMERVPVKREITDGDIALWLAMGSPESFNKGGVNVSDMRQALKYFGVE